MVKLACIHLKEENILRRYCILTRNMEKKPIWEVHLKTDY